MAIETKKLSLEKISIKIFDSEFFIDDVFINKKSFQDYLKLTFKNEFSSGRFKKPFMLRLERNFKSKTDSKESIVNSVLYGCTDNCCDYVYVKIKSNSNYIIWEKIGRNAEYIFPKKNNNKIEWLDNFVPISFSIANYNLVLNKFHSL